MGAWPLPTGDSPHASLGRLYTRSIMQHASCGHSSQFARDRTGLLLLVCWASVNFHAIRALLGGSFAPVSFGLARAPSRTVAAHGAQYELRVLSRVPLYTTLSIWTFVTNQRRILDDNAPKNSRSGAQLLVVKIPPWLFAVLVKSKKGHHK